MKLSELDINIKNVAGIIAGIFLIFGFVEARINTKVDKAIFEERLSNKDERLQALEKVYDIRMDNMEKNQERILNKLDGIGGDKDVK